MIKKLACKIVNRQIMSTTLKEEDKVLYIYAYQILINQTINLLATVIIAYLFHEEVGILVFLLSYIPLRVFAGGYHAKTNERCIIISMFFIFALCIILKITPEFLQKVLSIIFLSVSGYIIWKNAPVEAINRPLGIKEKNRYRRKARYIWIFEVLVAVSCGCVAFFTGQYKISGISEISLMISISHVVLSIALIFGKVNFRSYLSHMKSRNKEQTDEEKNHRKEKKKNITPR